MLEDAFNWGLFLCLGLRLKLGIELGVFSLSNLRE
jgi:hypothetical protein